MMTSLRTIEISAEQTVPLRHSVLRAGLPIEECVFPGDDGPDTLHVGTLLQGRIVAIASIYREPRHAEAPGRAARAADHDAGTAWRLRGMASAPEVRGRGTGAAALAAVCAHARTHGATLLWCNARVPAVGFYERMGWHVLGEEFDIPTAGPHLVMERPC